MIFHITSKKPVLLVGNGARSAGAENLIVEFATKINIPVLTTMNAVDLVQNGLRIGFIGTHGNRVSHAILSECDLLIAVGARLSLRQVGNITERFAPKAKLIRADIDEYELSRNIKQDEEKYLMDSKEFMIQLLSENIPSYLDWKSKCKQVEILLKDIDKQTGNIVIEQIALLLPPNPIIAVDVGQHQCWCAQSLDLKGNKGKIFIAGGYAGMGCALPFAIGASISQNNGIVYCITGDGCLQMNIQELEVLKREHLPIKIIVINNHSLGKIREVQALSSRYAQTTMSSGYSVPDFVAIAKAYNIKAVNLSSYEDLDEYRAWFTDEEPCLINVIVPNDTLLTPKIKWETGEVTPKISSEIEEKIKNLLGL